MVLEAFEMYLPLCLSRILQDVKKSAETDLIVLVLEPLNSALEPMTGVNTQCIHC